MYLLITGCGRSGTCYISNIIQTLGLDIKHENAGRNGRVDWHYASKLKEVYKKYDMVFHQVRHPLEVISSMQTTNSWKYIKITIPEITEASLIKKCMLYWYYWNQLVEPYAKFQYQLEQIKKPNIFNKFCELLNVEVDFNVFDKVEKNIRNFNKRNHKNLTWKNLERVDFDLTKNIKKLATKYGYKIK